LEKEEFKAYKQLKEKKLNEIKDLIFCLFHEIIDFKREDMTLMVMLKNMKVNIIEENNLANTSYIAIIKKIHICQKNLQIMNFNINMK